MINREVSYNRHQNNQGYEIDSVGEKQLYIFKEGICHKAIADYKLKLNWLGYGKSKITPKFGSYFKSKVKKFQSDYNLPDNGIMGIRTQLKIDQTFESKYVHWENKEDREKIQSILKHLGFEDDDEPELSATHTDNIIKKFQEVYELRISGILNVETLHKMETLVECPLQEGVYHRDVIKLKKDLIHLGYGKMRLTSKFGYLTAKNLKKFQYDYGLPVNGLADDLTLSKIQIAKKIIEKVTYNYYGTTLEEIFQFNNNKEHLELHASMNPNVLINDVKKRFLFLNLFRYAPVSVTGLNKFLEGTGILEGTGKDFIEAGKEMGVNVSFLLCHAIKYSDEGFVSIGRDAPVNESGSITYTMTDDAVKIPDVTEDTFEVVYDIYNLGSNDRLEYYKRALNNDWTTLKKAIAGGAEEILKRYDARHNTLYKMYMDSLMSNSSLNQRFSYDYYWILQKLEQIYVIHQQLDKYTLYFEIPVYKGQTKKRYIRG